MADDAGAYMAARPSPPPPRPRRLNAAPISVSIPSFCCRCRCCCCCALPAPLHRRCSRLARGTRSALRSHPPSHVRSPRRRPAPAACRAPCARCRAPPPGARRAWRCEGAGRRACTLRSRRSHTTSRTRPRPLLLLLLGWMIGRGALPPPLSRARSRRVCAACCVR